MKDIRKPEFMKAAIQTRSHHAITEIIIAVIVFLVGDIAVSVLQVPALMVYLMGNKEYISMILKGSTDMEKMLGLMQNLPDWVTVVGLLAEGGLILIFILYCRIFEKRKGGTMGFTRKKMVRSYMKGILMGAAAFLAAYGICILTGSVALQTGKPDEISGLYLIAFLIGYLIQGMAEEVICHGYLLVSLSRRYSVSVSVVISAIFFSMLHGMNAGISFLAYVNLFLFGIFTALLFVRCENIWVIAAVHSVWNYLQGNVFGIQVSGMKQQPSLFLSELADGRGMIHGGSFGLEGGLAVTAALLVANALILWNMSRKGYFVTEEKVDNPFDREYERERDAFIKQEMEKRYYQDFREGQSQTPGQQTSEEGQYQEQRQGEEKSYENMGLRPEETPWHPAEQEKEKKEMTEFNQSYFKE